VSPSPVLVYHRTASLTLDRYEDVIRRLTGKPRLESVTDLPFSGLLVDVAAQTDEGFVIFDVFDAAASLGAFREAVKPHRRAAGIRHRALDYPIHTFISAAKETT
jgi:hypothetical protein